MNNRIVISTTLLAVFAWTSNAQPGKKDFGYPISPVPFTSVKITDSFWKQRLDASRQVTIPLAFRKCEETGRYTNFVRAAHPGEQNQVGGYTFDDTDVYKTIEGAAYSLQTFPDKRMEHYIDSILVIVGKAQEPDGYLYTSRTMNPKHPHEWAGSRRWEKEEDLSHELYDLGHMIEGAIAYYQATGKRNFLDIAIRYADCVCREVGPGEHQVKVVPGHQIAEMALCKLYLFTGDRRYLDEAKFFLDMRGRTEIRNEYSQSHKPVIEQDEAVGHAVRAGYMYSGMADVAALTGDTSYIHAIDRIWENIISKKFYITGGVGSTNDGEAFGKNDELPNMSAYCETCAAIAQVYFNYRLFLLHGDSKYYDALERTLYNGLISGVSLDGGAFFYPNPLKSMGQHQRQPWFGCACCPSNICRFIPSLPGYVYAVRDASVYVNLFLSDDADLSVRGRNVHLRQTTQYPWNGDVRLEVTPQSPQRLTMKIRIPGWVRNEVVPSDLYRYSDDDNLSYTIKVNGALLKSVPLDHGYFLVDRKWRKGDRIDIHFDIQPRTVKADNHVEADRGRVAVERGPIVYCAEWPDNPGFNVLGVLINQHPRFEVTAAPQLLHGIDEIKTQAQTLSYTDEGKLQTRDVDLTLIPYYAWNHRGAGNMDVWMAQDVSAVSPALPATLASRSIVDANTKTAALGSVNDRMLPRDENDRTIPYFHWWPENDSIEWISYQFPEQALVSSSTVYWYDDSPWGGCRVPEWWKLYYKDSKGQWQPVDNTVGYETKVGVGNIVRFQAVRTDALKLEVKLPKANSSGLYEWEVK